MKSLKTAEFACKEIISEMAHVSENNFKLNNSISGVGK